MFVTHSDQISALLPYLYCSHRDRSFVCVCEIEAAKGVTTNYVLIVNYSSRPSAISPVILFSCHPQHNFRVCEIKAVKRVARNPVLIVRHSCRSPNRRRQDLARAGFVQDERWWRMKQRSKTPASTVFVTPINHTRSLYTLHGCFSPGIDASWPGRQPAAFPLQGYLCDCAS